MQEGSLSDYFIGVGAKTLKGTEVDPQVSHGHELQGIARFRQFIGDRAQNDILPVTYVWLSDDAPPVSLPLSGTWYDSRRNQAHRAPEYRFYYPREAEEVVYRAKAGDTLILCQPKDGPLLALFCPRGSSIERQLLWLFQVETAEGGLLTQVEVQDRDRGLDLTSRYILELIGVEVEAAADDLLDRLLATFGATFPPTRPFSAFARASRAEVDPLADPDGALVAWMDVEERLFMTLEKHIVGQRLAQGFIQDGAPDVDGFIGFSLGVQNRRKSRAGWAFAHHIEALLQFHGIRFKREATTEKRAGPDFLFPGEAEYHDPTFPAERLTMLAAKTSCKDRWRQVLAEANRIGEKHLLTLEPGISVAQTEEMRRERLQLVVPSGVHSTYTQPQRTGLISIREFLVLTDERNASGAMGPKR